MLLTLGMAENTCWTPFQSVVVNSLQGLAAGTILYVTFFEVLNNHKHHHHHHHQIETDKSKSSISQLIFILLGFLFMVVLELIGKCLQPSCKLNASPVHHRAVRGRWSEGFGIS